MRAALRSLPWWSLCAALASCAAGKVDDPSLGDAGEDSAAADGGGSDGGGDACDVAFDLINPWPNASDHFYLDPIEARLSNPDPTATLGLRDEAGREVAGSVARNAAGTALTFTPAAPLAPWAHYTAALSVCSGAVSAEGDFLTSNLGQPLQASVLGRSYHIDLDAGRGAVLGAFTSLLFGLIERGLLIGVDSASETRVELSAGLPASFSETQDLCIPTTALPTDRFDDPAFWVGPVDLVLDTPDGPLPLRDLRLRGAFNPDGRLVGGVRLDATLDARDLDALASVTTGTDDPAELCALVEAFDERCTACPHDGEVYCLAIRIDQLVGFETDDSLTCVDAAACHPGCDTSTCEDPAAGVCL